MTKIVVPQSAEELQELLNDAPRLRDVLATPETRKEFFDNYAMNYMKQNGGLAKEIETQVQSTMLDMVRNANGGRKPPVDLANAVAFENGRPTLKLGHGGTAAIARGRGTVYNRYSPGAQFETAYKEEDRFESIGEYCQAIREEARPSSRANRTELLAKLENVRSFMNSFSSEDPGAGGFLIPEIMRSELLMLALEDTIVRSRATVIPMSTLRVPIPTVDETSHVSSLFGGVVFYWTEEGAALVESQAKFGRVTLDAKKLTGYFKVPNELLADAPAFSAWFDTRIPAGLAWSEDVAFMTETGAGTPQGFIGSPAFVLCGGGTAGRAGQRATAGLIAYADIVMMYARMLPTSLRSAIWIAAIDTFPQLAQMSLSTPGVWMGGYNVPGAAEAPPISIFGRPVYFTEKVPALGTPGDISFVDLSYYLIGDRQAVEVAASEHVAFQNDQTAYRIIERVDGRPWLQSPLIPHNNSANTLSAFVGLTA